MVSISTLPSNPRSVFTDYVLCSWSLSHVELSECLTDQLAVRLHQWKAPASWYERKSLGACSWGCLPSSSHAQQGPGCPRHHQQQSQLPLPSAGWAPADSILLSAQALRRVPQIQQESRLLSANDVPKILMPLPPLTLPIPKMAVTSLVSSALCQHLLPALGLPISSINQSLDSPLYETANMTALLLTYAQCELPI